MSTNIADKLLPCLFEHIKRGGWSAFREAKLCWYNIAIELKTAYMTLISWANTTSNQQ